MPAMDDLPYTLPEEDPFNITPLFKQPGRRRSSLFNKWIIDQQAYSSTLEGIPDDACDAPVHSEQSSDHFLTVPSQARSPLHLATNASVVTIKSYDLVDDTDIPNDPVLSNAPSTPTRTSRFFSTPPSIRSLHLSFRSGSSRPSSPSPSGNAHTPLRSSFFPIVSRTGSHKATHNRSSSLGTLSVSGQSFSPQTPSPKWRPSVLGHFSSPAGSQLSMQPSETAYTPSRPSLSSTLTHTSTTVTDITTPLSKISFGDSVRSRSVSHAGIFYNLNEEIFSDAGLDNGSIVSPKKKKLKKVRSSRAPLSTTFRADDNIPSEVKAPGPHVAFSSSTKAGSIPRVSLSLGSRHQKKKKLIVSGIAPDDLRRFEGVKRWCESFGEVSHIIRMPNGDLQVHFKSAEVADTVCRLRAKVCITGVGSVNLSWSTGHNR